MLALIRTIRGTFSGKLHDATDLASAGAVFATPTT